MILFRQTKDNRGETQTVLKFYSRSRIKPMDNRPVYFPEPHDADENGLLALGGRLNSEWLLDAYTHGIFPWPVVNYDGRSLLCWFSPDPRCIFEFDRFHVTRRLERTCRSGKFRVTADRDFSNVIRACAFENGRKKSNWITPELIRAFERFHRLGHAHSVETWRDDRLVGGVYGVAIGGFFAGESMFHRERDASKVALVALIRHLRRQGFALIDIQVPTEHTLSFGAVEIPRGDYLHRLQGALTLKVEFGSLDHK